MTYILSDKSVHSGAPVELYKFEGPIASLDYHYTSYSDDIDYGGDTYYAIPIERSTVAGSTHEDSPELTIVLPVSSTLVKEYAFKSPPRSLDVTIYRMHGPTGTPVEYWKGEITNFNIAGSRASLRSPSLMDDPMRTKIPCVFYQGICNHVLYDGRCGITATDWDDPGTIISISGDTVTVDSVGAVADGSYNSGEIVRTADGERRLILSQVGTLLTLSTPFRELSPTDAITMYQGCPHTIEECRDKFNNVIRYGGFPYIPNVNPFLSGLKATE